MIRISKSDYASELRLILFDENHFTNHSIDLNGFFIASYSIWNLLVYVQNGYFGVNANNFEYKQITVTGWKDGLLGICTEEYKKTLGYFLGAIHNNYVEDTKMLREYLETEMLLELSKYDFNIKG